MEKFELPTTKVTLTIKVKFPGSTFTDELVQWLKERHERIVEYNLFAVLDTGPMMQGLPEDEQA